MRKHYIVIILFLTSVIGVSARPVLFDKPEIYIGTSHGATASMVIFSPAVKQDMVFGYNGGIMFRYAAEKNKSFQAEINFIQRGWAEKEGLYTRQLNYIEMPFMAHIYVGDKTRFIINIGPKVGYLLSEKVLQNNTVNSTAEQHTKKVQNPFDYGVVLGLGSQFLIAKQIFQVELRTNFSLGGIYSVKSRDPLDYASNLNFALNLGWMIRVK